MTILRCCTQHTNSSKGLQIDTCRRSRRGAPVVLPHTVCNNCHLAPDLRISTLNTHNHHTVPHPSLTPHYPTRSTISMSTSPASRTKWAQGHHRIVLYCTTSSPRASVEEPEELFTSLALATTHTRAATMPRMNTESMVESKNLHCLEELVEGADGDALLRLGLLELVLGDGKHLHDHGGGHGFAGKLTVTQKHPRRQPRTRTALAAGPDARSRRALEGLRFNKRRVTRQSEREQRQTRDAAQFMQHTPEEYANGLDAALGQTVEGLHFRLAESHKSVARHVFNFIK